MAADLPREQSLTDSKERVIELVVTDRGGRLVFVPGEPTTLRYYDARGRCLDLTSNLRGFRLALMGLPQCDHDPDHSTTGGLCDICGLDRPEQPSSCESCGAPASVRLADGSTWCKPCDASAENLGYDKLETVEG